MTAKLGALLIEAAAALGTSLDDATLANLETWLGLLEQWNARIDLTAARSPEALVDLMMADALLIAPRLAEGIRLVDVGTGAGAPGLALALLRRDLAITLAEPLGKRASFLRTVVGAVDRADVRIERKRGEALFGLGTWDTAVSRATLPPTAWLDVGTELAAPGGTVWVFIAGEKPPEHARAVLEVDLAYMWPLTGVPRRALGYRVIAENATAG